MPILQNGTDTHSSTQKLSKIETLRLARNYIVAMSQTLQEGKPMDLVRFIKILSRELSQTTANLLNGTLASSVNNSFVTYRRYLGNDYPLNGGNFQDGPSYPYHQIDWQDFNVECGGNNVYSNWYANYKYNTRYNTTDSYVTASDNCFHESCPKQLFYTEW